jgi:hypothetical protein
MNKALALIFSAGLLAGCSTTESGRVSYTSDGTKAYGLDDQPGSSATAEGSLMPGAYATSDVETGQFTDQERTPARVGQYPTPPREADIVEMERDNRGPRQVGTGIVPEWSAGLSGSTARAYASSSGLTASSLLAGGGGVNPPTAPTLAEPLTRPSISGLNNDITAFGASAGPEVGVGSQSLPPGTGSTSWRPVDNPQDSTMTVVPDLSSEVRQALTTGRAGRISTLTSDRIEDMDINALNGNVTLRGNVRSETERLMIENKVSHVPGVRSVNNQLRVITPTRKAMDDGTQPEERANILVPEK